MKTKLYSRQGYYLTVNRDNGAVRGVVEQGDNSIFFLIPVGLRIVSIQHMETMLYVAMNSEGRLYSTVKHQRFHLVLYFLNFNSFIY